MPRGRHAQPSNVPLYAKRAAVGGIGTIGTLSFIGSPVTAIAAPAEVWAQVANCESGGDPRAENPTSTASGLYQIIDGTWRDFGGLEFAPRASAATPEQQLIVAERILAGQGASAWVDPCDDPLRGQTASSEEPVVPTPAPPPPVEPVPVPEEPLPADDAPTEEIEVISGDTLSQIAVQDLGQADWRPLYEANRDVVGDNPHLIFPGQRLRVAGLLLATPPVPVDPPPVVIEEQGHSETVEPVPEQAVEQAEAATPNFGVAPIINSAGPVSIRAQEAADRVFTQVPGASLVTFGGTRGSAIDPDGHPSGNAIDYMVMSDRALGDAIVAFHKANWDSLGVQYIIWQQKYYDSPSSGGKLMENRGSGTANHMDHPHVNYIP